MPYEEPTGSTIAGRMSYKRQPAFYERFMDEQNIPIIRGISIRDSREVDLAPWERMGGRGAFIQFDGTEGGCGMYLHEVPSAGETKPEKHIYEKRLLVIEGRGTTEIWTDSNPTKQIFEWQPGSLFSIPLNVWHRLVNASRSPALILGVYDRADHHEPSSERGFHLQQPIRVHRSLRRQRRLLQSAR